MAAGTDAGKARQTAVTNAEVAGPAKLAGRAARTASFMVDSLAFVPLFYLAARATMTLGASPDLPNAVLWYPWLALLVGAVAYQAIFVAAIGATPGMLLAGVWVADVSGEPAAAKQALARAIVSLLSAGCLGLGYLWGLLHPLRQTWHDLVAETIVVRGRPVRRPPRRRRVVTEQRTYRVG